jgi:hypothetical protein
MGVNARNGGIRARGLPSSKFAYVCDIDEGGNRMLNGNLWVLCSGGLRHGIPIHLALTRR